MVFTILCIDDDDGAETNNYPNIHHIKKLEELPLHLCCLNKKVQCSTCLACSDYSLLLQ